MKQPKVCIFGLDSSTSEKSTDEIKDKIAQTTVPLYFEASSDPSVIIKEHSPDVIITVGNGSDSNWDKFNNLELKERQRWLHMESPEQVAEKVYQFSYCFVHHAIKYHNDPTLVSLFTTSYKSGDLIQRPFRSLMKQTYQNWEWVIVDDTDSISDGGANWANLVKIKNQDPRIRIYRSDRNSGVIGNMKNLASSLCRGHYLLELDHDDDIMPDAVKKIFEAFNEFPDAGFVYTDCVELHDTLEPFKYGEHFSLGYGSYYKQYFPEHGWQNVAITAPLNPLTIRYIVSCPNHMRAWRKSFFDQVGGWNHRFHVADDYEMMVRSFLHTKFVRVPFMSYLQYRNAGGNFTFIRNAEIQKLVRIMSQVYNEKIHERVLQLGLEDPHYEDWWNVPVFGKAWLNPRYEEPMNYVSHHSDDLVSIVIIVTPAHKDNNVIREAVHSALKQTVNKEVIVIGANAPVVDSLMSPIHHVDLKYWVLESDNEIDAKTYACKMVARGHYVSYWPIDSIEVSGADYLANTIKAMKDSGCSWSEDKRTHLFSTFKEGF
jgi:glycosyltransferase involved in cell wall biosynthesis